MDRTEPLWWEHHSALIVLTAHLADHGSSAAEVAYAVEKPWKFEEAYHQALAEIGEQLAIEEATSGD